jgi:hypothetical protein
MGNPTIYLQPDCIVRNAIYSPNVIFGFIGYQKGFGGFGARWHQKRQARKQESNGKFWEGGLGHVKSS